MFGLRRPEHRQGHDLGYNGAGPRRGSGDLRHHGPSCHLLIGIMGQDDAAVLRADIRALPVLGGWVMDGKKHLQQIGKGYLPWIEGDLHNLGMAGALAADLLIGRIGHMAAGIAGLHGSDADHFPKHGFQTPKAAAAKCSLFHINPPASAPAREVSLPPWTRTRLRKEALYRSGFGHLQG